MSIEERILEVRGELDQLRAEERNIGRIFHTAIPALCGFGFFWFYIRDQNAKLWFLIVPLALWSLAAATNVVRFSAPHRFTDIHERIARKEGELAGLEKSNFNQK